MTRPAKPADPTSEGTSDQPAGNASAPAGGRPGAEQVRRDDDDVVARTREERPTTPRRYDTEDPTMPSDDATVRTDI